MMRGRIQAVGAERPWIVLEEMKKVLVIIAVLVVLGALGGGFYLVGPPARERERRLDARRVSDLQRLRLAADLYWTRNGRLPATLEALAREAGTNIYSSDPASGERYAYAVTSNDTYEVCAVFTGESESPGDFWSHASGRQCFRITAKEIKP